MTEDERQIAENFGAAMNMSPSALRQWLKTDDSQSVGMVRGSGLKKGGATGEAVGHHMGQRILEIKAKKKSDLTDHDYADMKKVVGYVHRHLKQRPKKDVEDSNWRKSLMNWGHNPVDEK